MGFRFSIKSCKVKTSFQTKLHENSSKVLSLKTILTLADRALNTYQLKREKHHHLLHNVITITHKKRKKLDCLTRKA